MGYWNVAKKKLNCVQNGLLRCKTEQRGRESRGDVKNSSHNFEEMRRMQSISVSPGDSLHPHPSSPTPPPKPLSLSAVAPIERTNNKMAECFIGRFDSVRSLTRWNIDK